MIDSSLVSLMLFDDVKPINTQEVRNLSRVILIVRIWIGELLILTSNAFPIALSRSCKTLLCPNRFRDGQNDQFSS